MKTEAGRIEERFYGVSYLLLCAEKDRQKGGNRVEGVERCHRWGQSFVVHAWRTTLGYGHLRAA